ncbi:MAG: leucine-rich repeat protein [Candidatus Coprovivens sp.]
MSESAKANLTTIYINSCDSINALNLLKEIYNTEGNKLANIGILWKGVVKDTDPSNLIMLGEIAKVSGQEGGYRGATYNTNGDIETGGKVSINGSIHVNYNIYLADIDAIFRGIPDLKIDYDPANVYIPFEDDEVKRLVISKWGDGYGVTQTQLDAVTSIGTTFKENTSIVKFNELGKFGVKKLNNGEFAKCVNLTEIDLSNIETTYSYTNSGAFEYSGIKVASLPNLKSMTSANGAERTFYASAIERIESLGEITQIPDGNYSSNVGFACNASHLHTVVLPPTLKTIGICAFQDCTSLTNFVFPSSIEVINTRAFYKCMNLVIDNLSLPNLTSLGQDVFNEVSVRRISNLGKITSLPSANTYSQNFGKKDILEEITIPSGVTSIPNYCFDGYTKITSIDAGNCIIGASAFRGCTSLQSIVVKSTPNDNTNTDYGTFKGCTSLTSVRYTDDTSTKIGSYTFLNCTALESITLPNSVTTINNSAFNGCSKLTSITNWSTISKNLTSIGGSALNCPLEIGDLILPSLTYLGGWAFSSANITRVLNLGSITTFTRCDAGHFPKAELLILPSTITTLEAYSLTHQIAKLKTLIMLADTPPTTSAGFGTKATKIYVPDASVDVYKSATGWVSLADKIFPISQLETDNVELYAEIQNYL